MKNNVEQKIKGDNNDQSINKTENSNNITHEVNTLLCMENKSVNQYVQINNTSSKDDLLNACMLCLLNREPLIIEKASQKAMEKVNFLVDELRIILRDQTIQSEKINKLLEDPNFIYFLKDVQKSTIKSNNKDEIKTLAELISLRLKTEPSSMVELSIDEAVNNVSKLLPIHFEILSLIYVFKEIHLYAKNINSLIDMYESFIDMFSDVMGDIKQSTFLHLEYTKCVRISSIKINSNIIDFIFSEYYEFINKGIPDFDVPQELSLLMQKYNIPFKTKNDNEHILLIDKRIFNKIKNNISPEDLTVFYKYLNNNISKDEFVKTIQEGHKKLLIFSEWWNNSILSSMNLTNVGIAMAIAYLNATTEWKFSYEIWL